jgi:hypothetical protein
MTMVKALAYDIVVGHAGHVAMVLGWLAAAICNVVAVGILLIIISIRVLAELYESD